MIGNLRPHREPQQNRRRTARQKINNFLLRLDGNISEQQSGENSKEASADRRQCAQKSLRIPINIPLSKGQIFKIDVVGPIPAYTGTYEMAIETRCNTPSSRTPSNPLATPP